MYWHVCLHAISKPSYEVGYIGLWTHMPILILFTWGLFTHMLFLKLATLWHDSVILFTFYFWTGYMGVTEPSHIWRYTHLYAMCIHIPISQSNWKLHACDHTHAYQHRTVRNTCNCWHVTIFGNCIYDISIYDYTQNLCACDKYIYILTSYHTKNCMCLYMCAHILRVNMLRNSMCLNTCEYDNMWPCFETAYVWICEYMQKYVHSWKFHVIMYVYAKIWLCLKIVCLWKCVHMYTHKHTLTWLYLKNVCM